MPRTSRPFLLALALSPSLLPAADFPFRPNDRVVFLGDSVTEQNQFTGEVELYLTTRFPKANLTFLNAGVGLDTAARGAARFQAHVLDEKPTVVVVNFGMNDGGYGGFNAAAQKAYLDNLGTILAAAKKAGVRAVLLSPNMVDRRLSPRLAGYAEAQRRFYAPLRELAETHGAAFVDVYAATRTALEKMEAVDPEAKALKPLSDGIHPNAAGGLLMAHAVLTGVHARGAVSTVRVEASATPATAAAAGCTLEGLSASPAGVAFTRTDDALPVPVRPECLPFLPYVNRLDDLNWYGLTVTGLAPGRYAVSIDGTVVGTYTHGELADGVNLGNATAGPLWEQGEKVRAALGAKNALGLLRFKEVVAYQFAPPPWLADLGQVAADRRAKEMARRADAMAAAQAEAYKVAQPRPHKFEVRPAK